jgi:hypothetical protein
MCNIMSSEIVQTLKDTYHVLSLIVKLEEMECKTDY